MELIEEFRVAGLPNSLYVQYMTEVDARITEATPEALRIPTRYELYKTALNTLNAAYKRQVKNNLTESLEEKDKERDDDYRCFYAHAKADLYNHDPEMRKSAKLSFFFPHAGQRLLDGYQRPDTNRFFPTASNLYFNTR